MIKVLFFAHLKETLGCEQLELADSFADVAEIRASLAAKSELWAKTIGSTHTLVAVNQAMAQDATLVKAGDEVAFFPPVTGG